MPTTIASPALRSARSRAAAISALIRKHGGAIVGNTREGVTVQAFESYTLVSLGSKAGGDSRALADRLQNLLDEHGYTYEFEEDTGNEVNGYRAVFHVTGKKQLIKVRVSLTFLADPEAYRETFADLPGKHPVDVELRLALRDYIAGAILNGPLVEEEIIVGSVDSSVGLQ